MIVGVPRESFPGELRVALTPAVVPNLTKAGIEVVLEAGAGVGAGYPDAEYVAKGAKIVPQRADVFRTADIIVQVLCYGSNDKSGKGDLALLRRDQVLIGFLRPLGSLETVQEIAATGAISFSVELMPRTTRAQSMDALSSMGTICGYKAVLIAADTLAQNLSDADDCCRHYYARTRFRNRRRRGRTSSYRHRPPAWSRYFRLRYAARRKRTGAKSGRSIRRASHRSYRRAGRRRLRASAK